MLDNGLFEYTSLSEFIMDKVLSGVQTPPTNFLIEAQSSLNLNHLVITRSSIAIPGFLVRENS